MKINIKNKRVIGTYQETENGHTTENSFYFREEEVPCLCEEFKIKFPNLLKHLEKIEYKDSEFNFNEQE